jgi:hypothetical protein
MEFNSNRPTWKFKHVIFSKDVVLLSDQTPVRFGPGIFRLPVLNCRQEDMKGEENKNPARNKGLEKEVVSKSLPMK